MSGEATRDVTVRVSVVGGRFDKFPEFEKITTAADAFYKMNNEGMRQMRVGYADATKDVAALETSLRGLYENAAKSFGFNDISAAVEQLSQAQKELSSIDISDMNSEDAIGAVERLAQLEREVLNLSRQISSQEIGNLGMGKAADAAYELSEATEDVQKQAQALGAVDVNALGLPTAVNAAQGLSEKVETVVGQLTNAGLVLTDVSETAAGAITAAADQMESAAKAQQTAVDSLAQAAEDEGKSTAELTFKKIAVSERLAAFNRKAATEYLKQENDKKEAAKKSGEEQQRQMFAATGAIAQSIAAGTQFISLLRMMGGEGEAIEDLARKFAAVQATVQGIAAGTQAFNSLNQGLDTLQEAATAASAHLTATGGAATFTQGALIRLAPAAAAAQAALGPLAIAVAGVSLAIAGITAVSEYFAVELPDHSEENARQFEKVNFQLETMRKKIEANSKAMSAQNVLLQTELSLRQTLEGTTTGADVMEGYGNTANLAASDAKDATKQERAAAWKQANDMREKRQALLDEKFALETEDANQQSWWGGDGKDEKREKRKQQISEEIAQLQPQISNYEAASEGPGVQLAVDTIAEYTAAIEKLPEDQQAAYEAVLAEFVSTMNSAMQTANSGVESALRDNEQQLQENVRAQQDATSAFEEQQNIALRLEQNPEERAKLQDSVNQAAASGNLNAGIDAVSGVVSTEREQELRNQLAQGNLTREKLLAEIADAAEFETEKAELEKQVKALQEQAAALRATREELTAAQQQVQDEMRILRDELQQTQQVQQAL